ncbi:TlpA family protein disulfide reductase [Paenibacillus herberti]|uniref:Redoxin n=1 Tax=Paenibacillus herberti TaxID=1619309 RepID=A0A229P4A0_9BACL|nr:TlpA disulfide reductase family protein [Paenibacillus herberti]OXM16891.1 redoxin [Paenibacillus herberti]
MKRFTTTGILLVAVLLGVWIWMDRADMPLGGIAAITGNGEAKPKTGYDAPAFSLTGLDEQTYAVQGARKKPVFVNFWASWCGPCDLEAPDLQELYLKYGDQIDFYGVNSTSYDRERDARKFVDEKKLTFPIPMDRSGDVTKLYKVSNFPTTVLIGTDGKVKDRITGVIPIDQWKQKLDDLLKSP